MGTILVTGNSGYLGKSVLEKIAGRDNNITCISRRHNKQPGNIICDLSTDVPVLPDIPFDKMIHMAAQAHVHPRNERENLSVYLANVAMTQNLLKAADSLSVAPKQVIFISSVAVYGCDEGVMISESFRTNPVSSYGQSKMESEKLLTQWCAERNIGLLIFRLPLIAGLNALGNLGYMERAIQKGTYIKITNNLARKSVVLAADVGELIARTDITANGIYHLTDRRNPSISEIEKAFEKHFQVKILIRVAYSVVKMAAGVFDVLEKIFFTSMPLNSNKFRKLTGELTFNDDKAVKELGWNPKSVIDFLSQ